jgi:hypothetical protein
MEVRNTNKLISLIHFPNGPHQKIQVDSFVITSIEQNSKFQYLWGGIALLASASTLYLIQIGSKSKPQEKDNEAEQAAPRNR